MEHRLIQYRVRPESLADNEQHIIEVFTELHERRIAGVRYLVVRSGEGAFVHLVANEAGGSTAPLTSLPAFERFQRGARARCVEPPVAVPVTVVGSYRMLADDAG